MYVKIIIVLLINCVSDALLLLTQGPAFLREITPSKAVPDYILINFTSKFKEYWLIDSWCLEDCLRVEIKLLLVKIHWTFRSIQWRNNKINHLRTTELFGKYFKYSYQSAFEYPICYKAKKGKICLTLQIPRRFWISNTSLNSRSVFKSLK